MSAWSDWRCGAISDDEYAFECNREAAMDKAYEYYDDCDYEDEEYDE